MKFIVIPYSIALFALIIATVTSFVFICLVLNKLVRRTCRTDDDKIFNNVFPLIVVCVFNSYIYTNNHYYL